MDYRFKLWILNELIDQKLIILPDYVSKCSNHQFGNSDDEDLVGICKNCLQYVKNFDLKPEHLSSVKMLSVCAGYKTDLRSFILPFWDGENDLFHIKTFAGIELLSNLTTLHCYGGINAKTDFSALKGCQKLKEVSLNIWPGKQSAFLLKLPLLSKLVVPDEAIIKKNPSLFNKLKARKIKISTAFS